MAQIRGAGLYQLVASGAEVVGLGTHDGDRPIHKITDSIRNVETLRVKYLAL